MKTHKIQYDDKGRMYTQIGKYKVIKEGKSFCGIYYYGMFITSKTGWRQAIKMAKLLNDAYNQGVEDERSD